MALSMAFSDQRTEVEIKGLPRAGNWPDELCSFLIGTLKGGTLE